jgi:hypothetical protein
MSSRLPKLTVMRPFNVLYGMERENEQKLKNYELLISHF